MKKTPNNHVYIYILHLKGNQVKIKYPKLLEVYVNIECFGNQIAKKFRLQQKIKYYTRYISPYATYHYACYSNSLIYVVSKKQTH